MDQKKREKIALFRYSLIAPLITDTYPQESAKAYLKETCAQKFDSPPGMKKEYAPSTLKDWLRLYRKHGIDALYPKTRSDKGKSRKLTEKAKKFIINAKKDKPKRTAKSIYQELIAKGIIAHNDLSLSTVQRFISKKKLSRKKLEPVDRKAYEFEFPNECWQSDVSVGPYLNIDGKKHKTYIIAILDDATRLIIHCQAFFKENFLSLLSVFKQGVGKRGIPKKIFVDNAKIYKSSQMQYICASLGTILCFARPFSPESKGKVERWFETMHSQWMNVIDWNQFSSLKELNESLQDYVENNYNKTEHSSIDAKPIDKFVEHIDRIKFLENKKQLDNTFLYRVKRKVKKDATISLNTITFEVPMKYIGEKINVRYDPSALDKAFIFSEDGEKKKTIHPVDKVANSKVKREHNIEPVDFSSFSYDD